MSKKNKIDNSEEEIEEVIVNTVNNVYSIDVVVGMLGIQSRDLFVALKKFKNQSKTLTDWVGTFNLNNIRFNDSNFEKLKTL